MTRTATQDDRVQIPPDAFIRTTRQLWKLLVAGLVLPWPAVAIGWWSFRHLGPEPPTLWSVGAVGAMAAIAAFIVMLLASVRCPACGVRLLQRAMRDPAGLNALTALLKDRTCPACGLDPLANASLGGRDGTK